MQPTNTNQQPAPTSGYTQTNKAFERINQIQRTDGYNQSTKDRMIGAVLENLWLNGLEAGSNNKLATEYQKIAIERGGQLETAVQALKLVKALHDGERRYEADRAKGGDLPNPRVPKMFINGPSDRVFHQVDLDPKAYEQIEKAIADGYKTPLGQNVVSVTPEQREEFELAKAQLIRSGANPDAVYDMGIIEVIAAARSERAVEALRIQVEAGRRTVQNVRNINASLENLNEVKEGHIRKLHNALKDLLAFPNDRQAFMDAHSAINHTGEGR